MNSKRYGKHKIHLKPLTVIVEDIRFDVDFQTSKKRSKKMEPNQSVIADNFKMSSETSCANKKNNIKHINKLLPKTQDNPEKCLLPATKQDSSAVSKGENDRSKETISKAHLFSSQLKDVKVLLNRNDEKLTSYVDKLTSKQAVKTNSPNVKNDQVLSNQNDQTITSNLYANDKKQANSNQYNAEQSNSSSVKIVKVFVDSSEHTTISKHTTEPSVGIRENKTIVEVDNKVSRQAKKSLTDVTSLDVHKMHMTKDFDIIIGSNGKDLKDQILKSPITAYKNTVSKPSVAADRNDVSNPSISFDNNTVLKPSLAASKNTVSKLSISADINTVQKPSNAAYKLTVPKPPLAADKLTVPKPSLAADKLTVPKPSLTANKNNAPKPSMAANINIAPKPSIAADKSTASKPSMAANINIAPKSSISANINTTPKLSIVADKSTASKSSIAANINIAPKPSLAADKSTASKPSMAANINIAPKPSMAANINIAPKPSLAADKSTVLKPSLEANRNIAPKPSLAADKSTVLKPSLEANINITPKPSVPADKSTALKPSLEANRNAVSKASISADISTVLKPSLAAGKNTVSKSSILTDINTVKPSNAADKITVPKPSLAADKITVPKPSIAADINTVLKPLMAAVTNNENGNEIRKNLSSVHQCLQDDSSMQSCGGTINSFKMKDLKVLVGKASDMIQKHKIKTADIKVPCTKTGDIKVPCTKTLDVKVPCTKTLDVKVPCTKTLDVKVPCTKTLDVKVPCTKTLDVKVPCTKTPDTNTPDIKKASFVDYKIDNVKVILNEIPKELIRLKDDKSKSINNQSKTKVIATHNMIKSKESKDLKRPIQKDATSGPAKKLIKLSCLNPHLVCLLCAGYFVEATTIVECLHTFCKSCIVRYLQTSKKCPTCLNVIHETEPMSKLKLDRTMQDVMEILVPHILPDEMKRKKSFNSHIEKEEQRKNEKSSAQSTIEKNSSSYDLCPLRHPYREDEQINLKLQLMQSAADTSLEVVEISNRFVRCSARLPIKYVKRLLYKLYDIKQQIYKIHFECEGRVVEDDDILKKIFIKEWRRKAQPMVLKYYLSVKESPDDVIVKEIMISVLERILRVT